jgi:hypothetical protein
MKRWITCLLAVVVILAGCQAGEVESATTEPTATAIPPVPSHTATYVLEILPTLRPVQDRTTLTAQGSVEFKVIHWNDFHGALVERTTPEGTWVPGIARLASVVRVETSVLGADHTLVLDAGDWAPVGNPKIANSMLDLFKYIGLDAMTVGNHDLWKGLPALKGFIQNAQPIEMLSMNMMARDEVECSNKPLINAYQVYEITSSDGVTVRVGVVGMGREGLEYLSNIQGAYKAACFINPVASYEVLYPDLVEREKADVVIVVSHSGLERDEDFARQTNALGIAPDLIISGHSHSWMTNPVVIGKTQIAQVGEFGRAVGIFDLIYNRDSAALDSSWRQVIFNPCSPVDDETQSRLRQALPDLVIPDPQPCVIRQLPQGAIYLADMQPLSASVGYWSLGVGTFPATDEGMVQGGMITSHGESFPKGLFAHAPSELVYNLGGLYTRFHALINLKEIACGNGAEFVVLLDGHEVFRSEVLTAESEPVEVSLDVTRAKKLTLRTDELGRNDCDATIWGDPYVE